ncbi:uncharacterized protein LOC126410069 [Nymphaea colorata]|nr:uncharacterized protein LOC126410069 [Nymphaea colorata]
MRLKQRELEKSLARKHTSQFDPISLENFDDLEPWIEEEPATIFDDEDLECFNLEAETIEGFVDEGESVTDLLALLVLNMLVRIFQFLTMKIKMMKIMKDES